MHGLVRELALQVYKTICNNIFELGNLLHSTREVVEYFFILCPRKQRHWLVVLLFYVHGKHLRSCRDGQ